MFTGKKQSIESYQKTNQKLNSHRIDIKNYSYSNWGTAEQVMLEFLLTRYSLQAITIKMRRILISHYPDSTPNEKRNYKLETKVLKLKDM